MPRSTSVSLFRTMISESGSAALSPCSTHSAICRIWFLRPGRTRIPGSIRNASMPSLGSASLGHRFIMPSTSALAYYRIPISVHGMRRGRPVHLGREDREVHPRQVGQRGHRSPPHGTRGFRPPCGIRCRINGIQGVFGWRGCPGCGDRRDAPLDGFRGCLRALPARRHNVRAGPLPPSASGHAPCSESK